MTFIKAFFSWFVIVLVLASTASVSRAEKPAASPPDKKSIDSGRSMRVLVARSAYAGCEPKCDEWISAEGTIDKQTPAQFRRVLKSLGSRKLPIFISSGGGDVDSAIEVGRLVRAAGLDVAVTRTEFAPDGEPSASGEGGPRPEKHAPKPIPRGWAHSRQAFCASACTLILAAGKRRFVSYAAQVGVHEIVIPEQTAIQAIRYYQIRTLRKGDRIVSREKVLVSEKKVARHIARSKPSAGVYRKVHNYLVTMGESREVIDLMKTAPPEDIRWLTRTELASTRLSTDERGGETLIAPPPPPPQPLAFDPPPSHSISPAPPRSETGLRAESGATAARRLGAIGAWSLVAVSIGTLFMIGSLMFKLVRPKQRLRTEPPLGPKAE